MTNHPNRTPAYKVKSINGQFGYVRGKKAALARAIEMAGAPAKTSESDLRKHWGTKIERVSAEIARSVGL